MSLDCCRILVFNNGLTICFGVFVKESGNITDIVYFVGTFPITFTEQVYTKVGVTSTANGVVGLRERNLSSLECSIKPTTNATTNQNVWYIAVGV